MSERIEREYTRLVKRIIEAYERDTRISEMTQHRLFRQDMDSDKRFVPIACRRPIPVSWLIDSTYSLDVFYDNVGKSIAIGEMNYLIRQLEEHGRTEPRRANQFSLNELIFAIQEFLNEGYRDLKLFLPVDLFVVFHSTVRDFPPEKVDVAFEAGRQFLTLDRRTTAQLFWSNKHIDLRRVLLFDRGFGSWIVKPGNTSQSLSIAVEEVRGNISLYVRTLIFYHPVDQSAIKVLEFPQSTHNS